VAQALYGIPDDIRVHLDNVDVVVEEWPADDQLAPVT